ncbi:hypothetical protein BK138_21755 [Paenibacillus rhizosphaerae]|uniref:Uncharacterized protein n=1 Tax=Paenibacillus rhizosphaerae TaxID=297318 RepID=A0A1R1ELU3_9BACL|nr:hypothetical protein BK138_21755 [Paenibacillus rhizosphaerae]OXL86122.1 hypothetical protein BCV73_25850 [Paenibacillus sp. SSG-1]
MGPAPLFWIVLRYGRWLTGIINLTRNADIQINGQSGKYFDPAGLHSKKSNSLHFFGKLFSALEYDTMKGVIQ